MSAIEVIEKLEWLVVEMERYALGEDMHGQIACSLIEHLPILATYVRDTGKRLAEGEADKRLLDWMDRNGARFRQALTAAMEASNDRA